MGCAQFLFRMGKCLLAREINLQIFIVLPSIINNTIFKHILRNIYFFQHNGRLKSKHFIDLKIYPAKLLQS